MNNCSRLNLLSEKPNVNRETIQTQGHRVCFRYKVMSSKFALRNRLVNVYNSLRNFVDVCIFGINSMDCALVSAFIFCFFTILKLFFAVFPILTPVLMRYAVGLSEISKRPKEKMLRGKLTQNFPK